MATLVTITRTLIDENTSGAVKTTYVGEASMYPGNSLTTSKGQDIWKITKYVETTTGAQIITETLFPVDSDTGLISDVCKFEWDNRASYVYQ